MADPSTTGNRKQRRAAKIQYAQPDRSGAQRAPKTLFELAEERQALLEQGRPFKIDAAQGTRIPTRKGAAGEGEDEDEPPIGALGQAVSFAATLCMLHFTLDVLVYHQYRQEIEWDAIGWRTLTTLPILVFLVYAVRRMASAAPGLLAQSVFLTIAVAAGSYLVYAANEEGYYAVMKRAPPLGVLWVWSVIELKLVFAVVSLLAVAAYTWWGGYTIL